MIENNITKQFGKNIVLEDASIALEENKCHLLIGKNGSGKTTVLKTLCGLIRKYSGSISKMSTFLLLDGDYFFPYKTGKENLEYLLNEKEMERTDVYIDYFKMNSYINRKVKTYSNGMKKKLGLVLTFSKEEDVILLDEPTNSLDSNTIFELKKLIKNEKKTRTFLIASHDYILRDTELIDHIFMIKDKRIIEKELMNNDYKVYKIRTKEKIPKTYEIIFEKGLYKYIKINDVDRDVKELTNYGLLEFTEVNYTDEVYLEEEQE